MKHSGQYDVVATETGQTVAQGKQWHMATTAYSERCSLTGRESAL